MGINTRKNQWDRGATDDLNGHVIDDVRRKINRYRPYVFKRRKLNRGKGE